jgi:outer membrane protein OmpA-like peptidoglycan-associated protein
MKKIILQTLLIFLICLLSIPSSARDCGKAEQYFQKAVQLKDPQNPQLALIKKEQLYKKAISLCPSLAEAQNNLGDVYEKQGKYEEAIAQYKKATELAPEEACPYFGLGDIYYKTNRFEQAKMWYEKGLKYNRDDRLTNERLEILNDIRGEGVIKADTIRGMLSAPISTTRGAGEVVSITFGEGLIPFDYDKDNIRKDAKPQLDEIGKALRNLLEGGKDISIEKRELPVFEIAGHTDIRGTDEYNFGLSKRRANTVVNYLVNNFGISRDNLTSKGYGERVPLCTAGDNEACHGLNRRVEIIRSENYGVRTRSVSFRGVGSESKLSMDVGFFYQKHGQKQVNRLNEGSRLRSGMDKYFIFFRPVQDCYAYILQEDATGKVDIIFPQKGSSERVKVNQDYWVPRFGGAYNLDNTKGEEKLYLLVTSWPIQTEIEDLSLKDQIQGAVKSLKTRTIYVERPQNAPEQIHENQLNEKPDEINQLLTRIQGKEGWVNVVRFWHE